jgi:predicted metal-dependent hydrolase
VVQLSSSRCSEMATPALLRGIEEFNAGLFFEQHETLEDAWIEEDDPIRYLYQGILQVGVGFYHVARANFAGATSLLRRGMQLLEPFAPVCMGVDVEALLADTERARRVLVEGGPSHISSFDRTLIPRIRLIADTNGSRGNG